MTRRLKVHIELHFLFLPVNSFTGIDKILTEHGRTNWEVDLYTIVMLTGIQFMTPTERIGTMAGISIIER